MWHLLNMHNSADQKTRIVNMAPRCRPSGTTAHTHPHRERNSHSQILQMPCPPNIPFSEYFDVVIIFLNSIMISGHRDTWQFVVCGKSWRASRIPPELTFSQKPALHSIVSPLSSHTFTLSTHTHTPTRNMNSLGYAIRWPGGSSEDRLDCRWLDIKKYLMGPRTHARTHLWSMRLSTATFRN